MNQITSQNWNQLHPSAIKGPLLVRCLNEMRTSIRKYIQEYPMEEVAEISARIDGEYMAVHPFIVVNEVKLQMLSHTND